MTTRNDIKLANSKAWQAYLASEPSADRTDFDSGWDSAIEFLCTEFVADLDCVLAGARGIVEKGNQSP